MSAEVVDLFKQETPDEAREADIVMLQMVTMLTQISYELGRSLQRRKLFAAANGVYDLTPLIGRIHEQLAKEVLARHTPPPDPDKIPF